MLGHRDGSRNDAAQAEWFRVLFERSADAMTLIEPETLRILDGNEAFARAAGVDRARISSLSIADIGPERQPGGMLSIDAIRQMIELAIQRGSYRAEWLARRSDGRPDWLDVVFTSVTLGERRVVLTTARNINTQKRAEAEIHDLNRSLEQRIAERTEELRGSEEKFRALFQESGQGVMLHDEASNFSEVNPAAAALFGLPAQAFAGRHPAEFSAEFQPNGERSDDMASRQIELCRRDGTARFEWTHLHVDGHEVHLEVVLSRIPHGGKNLMQAVVTDISERKRIEQEMKHALEREKELNQLKSDFVSMVSHEFRTPLAIIQSSAEILDGYLDQLTGEERSEQLRSIIKNSRRMTGLMEDVLLLGRLDSASMRFDPVSLDPVELGERLIEEVGLATDHRCPIHFSTTDLPPRVSADERLMRHILLNLLNNAVKYSSDGSPVEFHAAFHGGELIFEIRDRGIGIPTDDLPALFEAFRRGSNVGGTPGTGLGLVIVKRSLKLHGGRLHVSARREGGTIFQVMIPLNDREPPYEKDHPDH